MHSGEERGDRHPSQPPATLARNVIYVQRERSLPCFRGDGFDEVSAERWAAEMRRGTRHMAPAEAAETVLSYLDGPAQVEVDLLPLPTQACADKLIEAVVTAFGDKRSTGALRDALYTRNQRPHESVREYSNALLSLFGLLRTKTGEENPVTQTALSERFVEGLGSNHLKTKFYAPAVIRASPDFLKSA